MPNRRHQITLTPLLSVALLPVLLGPTAARAEASHTALIGKIQSIPSPTEVLLEEPAPGAYKPGDLLVIRAKAEGTILGYAEVTEAPSDPRPGAQPEVRGIPARVRSHSSNALIRVDDSVEWIDLTDSELAGRQMQQGRHDLVVRGKKDISAKYKQQVYLGVLTGQTAANVERGEFFIGPGLLAYGLTETWQVSTQPFLDALGEANLHIKWQAFQNEDYRISLAAERRYNFESRRPVTAVSAYWDTFSNSKFLTYNQLKILSGDSELYDRNNSAQFSVNYGYITNGWDRIIFGPNFDLQEETLGGLLSYQWVWDHFHAALSFQTRDFTRFDFGNEKSLLLLDFWFRF